MLTDRQKKIMIAIVEGYTSSNYAEPIGSSALAKHDDLNVSTATLRNEMALLEELGYQKLECEDYVAFGGGDKEILFDKQKREFTTYDTHSIDMEELKAIYKYCEEHNWI